MTGNEASADDGRGLRVLALNAGSTSIKVEAFEGNGRRAVLRGEIGGIGSSAWFKASGQIYPVPSDISFDSAIDRVFDYCAKHIDLHRCIAIGHRLVHGGPHHTEPITVTDEVMRELEALVPLAPLHMPFGLALLRRARLLAPGVPHVACFDTAFHASLPDVETRLPLPRRLREAGYRRYGFHGLAYEHVVRHLSARPASPLPRRVLAAHLGSGASLCAMRDGRSIATTMGYSALDGLIMATRPGALDPGVVLALIRDQGLGPEALERLFYKESGLLALSGLSGDMRMLLSSEAQEAREAIDSYVHAIIRNAGALVAVMGGLDCLVFSGGVGENAAPIRERVVAGLAWLGDFTVEIIEANEEKVITGHALSRVRAGAALAP